MSLGVVGSLAPVGIARRESLVRPRIVVLIGRAVRRVRRDVILTVGASVAFAWTMRQHRERNDRRPDRYQEN